MSWQYNNTLGGDEEAGWIWVQGYWSWGAVLAWHVVDVSAATGFKKYYWVLNLWQWHKWHKQWECLHMHSMQADPNYVEEWMVHHLEPPTDAKVGRLMDHLQQQLE